MASQSQTVQEKGVEWTAIVLTCQYKDSVYAFQRELEIRRQKNLIPPGVVLLTVEDPKSHVGSGGATLNALLVVAEHLSAKAGYTVVTSDVLQTAHILIVHMGRDFPFDGCGRAFTCLPLEGPGMSPTVEALVCNIDVLLHTMTHKVAVGAPPGVWVCSTDMILSVPTLPEICWDGFKGVKVVSVPGSVSYAQNHGVYSIDQEGFVCDIIYQGTKEQINKCVQPDGKVPLVSGIVFFSSETAEKLLSTHVIPPLDACTYMGLDSGAKPIQLSLFFDILLCMARGITEEEFVHGQSKYCSNKDGKEATSLKNARALLWKEIRGIPLRIAYIPEGVYSYMTMSSEDHIQNLTQQTAVSSSFVFHQLAYSHVTHPELLSVGCSVVNSLLEGEVTVESQSAIQHCHLQGPLEIGKGCLLIGLDVSSSLSLRGCHLSDIIIQAHYIRLRDMWLKVFTIFGLHDDLQKPYTEDTASYLNGKWSEFFERTGIRSGDIWGSGVPESDQCLLSAQLFPVFHASEPVALEDVLWFLGSEVFTRQDHLQKWNSSWRMSLRQMLGCLDQEALLESRREIFFSRAQRKAREILLERKDDSLLPLIRAAVNEGYEQQLLDTIDHVASRAEDPGVAARALACIADILGCMARGHGGLRSGPAANRAWSPALQLLEGGDVAQGVEALREERTRWLSRPDLLVRAARHYEGAEQILIRQAVMSACCFVTITETHLPSVSLWVIAECPARIDVSGGWSDTPPITYEHGGAVVDVAILVDKCKPIGAKVRRISEPKLKLVSASGVRDGELVTETVCETLEDLQDYCQPHSPGALLKAAFICTEVIIYPSKTSLQDQLMQRFGGGFELHTWSKLPHGSGLGTSSILAGAVMSALYSATGKSYNTDSLIHAVLHLEQILTTGGGWQDQVGGLVPGVKIGRSKAQLPLRVDVEQLSLPEGFVKTLNEHLLLVYTGKTRLARNLLQDVLRNWYARLPAVVQNADSLVANAEECAKAFSKGDLLQIGECLNTYWQQKKCMAPGCEPQAVKKMMDALQPHVYGQSLAGAGGGGFLYLLTKEANQKEAVRNILANTEGLGDFSVHDVDVDLSGISVAFSSSEDTTDAGSR